MQLIWFSNNTWLAILESEGRASVHSACSDKKKIARLIQGDLQTIFRFSYLKVYKLITLGTKFKNL